MTEKKITQLQIRNDRPTAISSTAHGANLNAFGFNIDLIALKNPKLATSIIKLYGEAHRIQTSDPNAPGENFELFNEALKKFVDPED